MTISSSSMATQTTVTCGLPSLFSVVVRWASGPVATRVRTDPGIVMVLPTHVMKIDGYRENLGFWRNSFLSKESSAHTRSSGCGQAPPLAYVIRRSRRLGRMLLMLHHVDELAQWIANVETAHTPRFAPGTVFN